MRDNSDALTEIYEHKEEKMTKKISTIRVQLEYNSFEVFNITTMNCEQLPLLISQECLWFFILI